MTREYQDGFGNLQSDEQVLDIPPFRIQSADFMTVKILTVSPYVVTQLIGSLDDAAVIPDGKPVFVVASQQCFSEKVLVEGELTNRNIIRHVRKAYRSIYRDASSKGVRSELDSLRTLVAYSIKIMHDESGTVLVPSVSSDNLE